MSHLIASVTGRYGRVLAEERLEKRKAALAFVMDSSGELLAAMRSAGLGSELELEKVRKIRKAASRELEGIEGREA
jgi:hypothetical protein